MGGSDSARPRRVLVLGATGTIGRATVRALVSRGHEVVCVVRRPAGIAGTRERIVDLTDPLSLARDGVRGESFDVLMSCLASRTGLPEDAWAIDYGAHVTALHAGQAAGVTHVVLLSAICLQKPVLAFQHAKLAFEQALIASGLDYTIVRPTAFFKSLSGQIDRVRRGKPFLIFGDGTLTACKPISDDDLGRYLAECLDHAERRNRVLPIGGPGEAITPKAQGEQLFALLGREPRFTHVPVRLLDVIVAILTMIGRWIPALAAKAELARIGRYYATESMLVLDPATGRYDAQATPSAGSETLFDYYAHVIRGEAVAERGDHAVF
ncbi:NAD(P)H-binding protein [Methylobacterium sp. J-030]|uniref:NAD(P)H-binding protein n=1 Tax=Methylobacterium sp. J-030 TaxID=2836627 RepID=UPI001FBBFCF8|nr:NAD(P)H-binding protein [Methylobacterium sp. J-030]MCJ2069513.1 NAD(P)H-binding protein [Methylobacterium sp. J-030]